MSGQPGTAGVAENGRMGNTGNTQVSGPGRGFLLTRYWYLCYPASRLNLRILNTQAAEWQPVL